MKWSRFKSSGQQCCRIGRKFPMKTENKSAYQLDTIFEIAIRTKRRGQKNHFILFNNPEFIK